MPRETFQQQLRMLQENLMAMGLQVDAAIGRAIDALANRDAILARDIIANDVAVNQAQREIEEQCLILIATQQPLASDLRIIMSIAGIASELERMADHAEGIAKITLRLADEPLLKPLIDIPRMAEIARLMLREQLTAFVNRDASVARRLSEQDDEVDRLYDQVFRELLVFMMNDPRTITRATYLLWVAHNLERIADRTTNIGERVVFLTTGQVEELNVKRAQPG
ncbi:MAG: phosphate signaling complex protein PhoU [Anaerolineae bacterium]|nr:phosphate signaling complex protein PhoU [Anaerolineae bacterium]